MSLGFEIIRFLKDSSHVCEIVQASSMENDYLSQVLYAVLHEKLVSLLDCVELLQEKFLLFIFWPDPADF